MMYSFARLFVFLLAGYYGWACQVGTKGIMNILQIERATCIGRQFRICNPEPFSPGLQPGKLLPVLCGVNFTSGLQIHQYGFGIAIVEAPGRWRETGSNYTFKYLTVFYDLNFKHNLSQDPAFKRFFIRFRKCFHRIDFINYN